MPRLVWPSLQPVALHSEFLIPGKSVVQLALPVALHYLLTPLKPHLLTQVIINIDSSAAIGCLACTENMLLSFITGIQVLKKTEKGGVNGHFSAAGRIWKGGFLQGIDCTVSAPWIYHGHDKQHHGSQ
eukprot:1158615-Pelagomonas_calceolata.AAC.3